jgi:hypothetical protein
MEVSGQLHGPPLYPGDTAPNIHCVGSWVETRASLDVVEKRKFS